MVIVPYDEKWSKDFCNIKSVLLKYLSIPVIIEHVGSTSIVGMYAKPIIDLVIAIDKSEFQIIKNDLFKIGYIHEGDLGIIGREAFKRENIIKYQYLDEIIHHLYVCSLDNTEYKRFILFRNYLRNHSDKRDEYKKIKMEIIDKYGQDNREKYVSIKENEYKWFFENIIEKAKHEVNTWEFNI